MNRRPTMPRAMVVLAALACVTLSGVAGGPAQTDAAWTDAENARGSMTAGTVSPVTQMTCTAGLLSPVTFNWTAPAGGLTRTGYRWTVTGTITGNGTLASTATSHQLSSNGAGSGTYSLYAVGPGGWESLVKTGSLSFTVVLVNLVSSCSVP